MTASGNRSNRGRHSFPIGDGGRRLCKWCGRPTRAACADHPEEKAARLLGRIEGLLKNGDLSDYQRHKLRKLQGELKAGGAM